MTEFSNYTFKEWKSCHYLPTVIIFLTNFFFSVKQKRRHLAACSCCSFFCMKMIYFYLHISIYVYIFLFIIILNNSILDILRTFFSLVETGQKIILDNEIYLFIFRMKIIYFYLHIAIYFFYL